MASGVSLHFEKHKANDVAVNGLQRHNERVPGQNHSNKNIRDADTENNVFLKKSDEKFNKEVESIIESNRENGLKGVRKDAVRMVEATVQLSGDVLNKSDEEQEQVLRDSYDYLKNEFGEDNVVSAVIHKDETNMHLHFDFVPIDEDKKLNAKKIISKPKLQQYQRESLKMLQEKHSDADFQRGFSEFNGLKQSDFEKLQKEREKQNKELEARSSALDDRESKLDETTKTIEDKALAVKSMFDNTKKRVSELDKRESKLDTRESSLEARESSLEQKEDNYSQKALKLSEAQKRAKDEIKRKGESLNQQQAELNTEKQAFEEYKENWLNQARESINNAKAKLQSQVNAQMGAFTDKLRNNWNQVINRFRNKELNQQQVREVLEKHNPLENIQDFAKDIQDLAESDDSWNLSDLNDDDLKL